MLNSFGRVAVARFLVCGGCSSLAFVLVRGLVCGGGKRQCAARRVRKKRDTIRRWQWVAWVGNQIEYKP